MFNPPPKHEIPDTPVSTVEQVSSKLKTLPRKTDPSPVEATWRQIGSILHAFPPHECANYLRNSGYASA